MLLISRKTGYMSVIDKKYIGFTTGEDRKWNWFSVARLNRAIEDMNRRSSGAMFDNSSRVLGEHYDRQYNIERDEKGIQFGCQMLPWKAVDTIVEWLSKQEVELTLINKG